MIAVLTWLVLYGSPLSAQDSPEIERRQHASSYSGGFVAGAGGEGGLVLGAQATDIAPKGLGLRAALWMLLASGGGGFVPEGGVVYVVPRVGHTFLPQAGISYIALLGQGTGFSSTGFHVGLGVLMKNDPSSAGGCLDARCLRLDAVYRRYGRNNLWAFTIGVSRTPRRR